MGNTLIGLSPKLRQILAALDSGILTLDSNLALTNETINNLESTLGTLLSDFNAFTENWDDHNHSIQYTYPTLADAPIATAGSTAWALGNFTEIIPANHITQPFDLHFLNNGVMSEVTTCEVQIFIGPVGSEQFVGQGRIVRVSNQTRGIPQRIQTPIFTANTRVSVKIAAKVPNTTLAIGFSYHKY